MGALRVESLREPSRATARCPAIRPMASGDQELALAELIGSASTSPEAAAVLRETVEYLGAGLGTLVNLFNPERIILGGWAGLQLGARFLPEIRESAKRHALRHLYAATEIALGQLGPGAVARGAATLPLETFLNGFEDSARPAR